MISLEKCYDGTIPQQKLIYHHIRSHNWRRGEKATRTRFFVHNDLRSQSSSSVPTGKATPDLHQRSGLSTQKKTFNCFHTTQNTQRHNRHAHPDKSGGGGVVQGNEGQCPQKVRSHCQRYACIFMHRQPGMKALNPLTTMRNHFAPPTLLIVIVREWTPTHLVSVPPCN